MNRRYTINSERALEACIADLRRAWTEHKYITLETTAGKTRTARQNRALHLWLTMLAAELNDAGLDMRRFIRAEIDIPWTRESAKDYIWRPVQRAMFRQESTTRLRAGDYSKVYDVLNRHLGERYGIYIPWPQVEDQGQSRRPHQS